MDKRLRQEARRGGYTVHEGATPMDVLRDFLPEASPATLDRLDRLRREASSRALSKLRREPGRPTWWTRLWDRLLGRTTRG